jgi:phospholipid/cholesterol/gamma-HCH transport system substrate-binding protein
METQSSQKIKTGMFVSIGLLLLLFFTFVIGSRRNMFSSTFRLSGDFKNVSGLMIGSPVRLSGINVGVVEDISIKNDSLVQVDLVIESEVKKYIKTDSKISISSDGLMGDKLILISSGVSGEIAKHNQSLDVKNPVDIDKFITRMDSITNHADVLVSNVSDIFEKMNNGKGSLGRLLNNNSLAKNLEATVESTNNTVKKVGENMDAAKNSVLLKGYFRKKEKAKQKKLDEQNEIKNLD